jgi:hypothetical protein
VLFLIAAAGLPDESGEEIDLRAYYARNRRYFWSLVAIFQAIYLGLGLYFVAGHLGGAPRAVVIGIFTQWALLVAVPVVLIVVRSRCAHFGGLVVLYGINLWHYAPYAID